MEISLEAQTLVFLQSILLGAALSLFYDWLRAFRHNMRAGVALTALLDAIFWIVVLISFFLFVIVIVQGEGRAYILLGTGLGAALYFMTISPIIIEIFGSFFNLIKSICMLCGTICIKMQNICRKLRDKIKKTKKQKEKRKKHFQFPVKRFKIK